MSIYEIIILAVALSMDAFAVSVCKGLSMKNINYSHTAIIALFMGFFQALMPTLGWLLGSTFQSAIQQFDHWIAFVLLSFIGGKMIYESLMEKEEQCECKKQSILDIKQLFILAVATSIDALAAGITFAFLMEPRSVIFSVVLIGSITFAICYAGVMIGNKFGIKYKSKAEITGGIVLILLGIKILLEHTGIFKFI